MDTKWKNDSSVKNAHPFQKLRQLLHFPIIVVWIRIFRIFRITDDVAGLIFRVKGMGAYILHFADAIIAAAKRINGYFLLHFKLQRAPSKQTPTPKNPRNPRNPVNPDSKSQPTPNAKKSSKSCKSWFKIPTNAQRLKILEILKILIQNQATG